MDAKALREKMKEKARRLAGGGDAQNVDSSSFTPAKGNPDTCAKVGMKPISRKAFKNGGTVATEIANTDQKAANDARPGKMQVGGYAKGGKTEIKAYEKKHAKVSIDPNLPAESKRKIFDTNETGNMRAVKKTFATGGSAYSKTAVDKEIAKDKRIKPKEAAAINALLKGRQKSNEPDSDDTMKRGRRTAKAGGGTLTMDKPLKMAGTLKPDSKMMTAPAIPLEGTLPSDKPLDMDGNIIDNSAYEDRRKKGGRVARKDGGAVKKGSTNINIVISQPGKSPMGAGEGMPSAPPMLPRPPMPLPPPVGGPAPAMMPPSGLGGAGMPPGLPPMMGRKSGGAVNMKYPDMKFGSGSGEGRLAKIKAYGDKA